MPWNVRDTMNLRQEFVLLAQQEESNRRELCRRFGISAQTAYKWLRRFAHEGLAGLADRSRRPHDSPRLTPSALEAAVLDLRREHPAWGGRKISRRLLDLGLTPVPAPSTVTSILHRHGQIGPAASENATAWQRFEHEHPNDLWQIDFKGDFPTLREGRCRPLTVLDDHSRYNLVLQACSKTDTAVVQKHLTDAFRRYGLPLRLNADNGSPWGVPRQPGSLSELAIWLIRLGIRISYSRPYHPQTNGKDERFHRSLKAEVLAGHHFATFDEVQRALDYWREVYNQQRPHDSLGMETPIRRYQPSALTFPETLKPVEYAPDDLVLRVGWNGELRFKGRRLRVSKTLQNLHVAARRSPENDNAFDFYYAHHRFMTLDLNNTTGTT